jgi:hypothetical protein
MLRQGTIPAVLIGRQWRIRRAAIDAWLAAQEKVAKVITQRGGRRPVGASGDRLSRAATFTPEELEHIPLSKPPRPPGTAKRPASGARKPPP